MFLVTTLQLNHARARDIRKVGIFIEALFRCSIEGFKIGELCR